MGEFPWLADWRHGLGHSHLDNGHPGVPSSITVVFPDMTDAGPYSSVSKNTGCLQGVWCCFFSQVLETLENTVCYSVTWAHGQWFRNSRFVGWFRNPRGFETSNSKVHTLLVVLIVLGRLSKT